jgi:RNA-directed DNA polymerase
MQRHSPHTPFERYADDVIVHCRRKDEAQRVLAAIAERFAACGLTLHPTKTRIVYCKDDRRSGKQSDQSDQSEHVAFDFLSFTFKARPARDRQGQTFFGFLPAISRTAATEIRATVRGWRLATKTHLQLGDLVAFIDPVVRGWWDYYGRFYPSACGRVLHYLNQVLVQWVRRKYKRVHRSWRAAAVWLSRLARRDGRLCELWRLGVLPTAGE